MTATETPIATRTARVPRSRYMVAVVFLSFFVMSFVTNILGPIVPDIISSFRVSLAVAAALPFSFFAAYGVMSIPAGFLIERYPARNVLIGAFTAALIGSLSFALHPTFGVAAVSLFVMGCGMATLQTSCDPLLRVAGGEEHFAFNSSFSQLIFGSASFISPHIYSYLVANLGTPSAGRNSLLRGLNTFTPPSLPWVSMYWLFACVTLSMVALLTFSRLPHIRVTSAEAPASWNAYRVLLRRPMVWSFFFCIFCYVGSEQGATDWMSKFLSVYHGYDPHTTGASSVAWFWGLMTVGCFIGMGLLKLFDSRHVLRGAGLGAIACLTAALFGPARVSVIAFPAIGLFASVMWPVLVSLALNSVAEYHGAFAGILCTGIVGGAFLPLIIGRLADSFGLRAGICCLYVTFCCVMSAGFWARPIITNATIDSRRSLGAFLSRSNT
jgi:MFS transporter, FHS family, L-fucose permease